MLPKATAVLLVWSMFRPLAAAAQEPPGWEFVPGSGVLLSDDFTSLPWGAALPNWTMRGGVGRLLNGRLAFEGGSGTRMTPNITSWPGGFTIEMDFQAPTLDNDNMRIVTWEFNKGDITAWYSALSLYAGGQCSLLVLIADPGENQRVDCAWLRDAPNKFALWFENGRLRVYLNGKRIIDSNQMTGMAFRTAALVLSGDGLPVSFGSFRIAESTGAVGDAGVRQDVRSTVGGALPPTGGSRPLEAPQPGRNDLRQPSLSITSPQRGDMLVTGVTYPISWQYQWDSGPARIELLAATGGSLWIAPSVPLDGSGTGRFDWHVFENLGTANNYFIRITSLSDSTLSSIVGPVNISRPTITITSPGAGASFPQGETVPIRWTYTGKPTDRVRLTATLQGSSSPVLDVGLPIGNNGQGEYPYWVPQATAAGRQFTVRVEGAQDPTIFSETTITIAGGAGNSGGAGSPSPARTVSLSRAVAIFETQDENKDKETAVTVAVTTRDTTPGRTAGVDTVATILDAAGSSSPETDYRPFTTDSLGLSVNPNIRPGDCGDLVLWVNTKPSARLVNALQFDTWRFRVRVELYFSDGTRVIRSSTGNEERGGVTLPQAQPIPFEVVGPTRVETPEITQPAAYYESLVSELRLYIQTGADDLRGDSEVNAEVMFNNRPSVTFWNINKGQRWPDNTSSTVILPFSQAITLGEISAVRLTKVARGSMATDNWNMNALEVAAVVKGTPARLMRQVGTPILYRFTGTEQAYTITR